MAVVYNASTDTVSSPTTSSDIGEAASNFILDIRTADAKINGGYGTVIDRHGEETATLNKVMVDLEGFGASIYETPALGLAATNDGDLFMVAGGSPEEFALLYKNVADVAVAQGPSLPSSVFVTSVSEDLETVSVFATSVSEDLETVSVFATSVREDLGTFGELPLDTDAFNQATVDVNGYAQRVSFLDGSVRTADTYLDTDAFLEAIVDSDGYASQVSLASGKLLGEAAEVSSQRPSGDKNLLIVYGQSVFMGFDTSAISTSSVSGLEMFNGGSRLTDEEWNDTATSLSSLVSHVTADDEDASRGIAEQFLQTYLNEEGTSYTSDYSSLVSIVPAQGGRRADELGQHGAYFSRLEDTIDAFASLASSSQFAAGIVPVVYCQGEADRFESAPVWLRRIEQDIRLPLQEKLRSTLGQAFEVVMVMTQVAPQGDFPANQMAMLELCKNNPHYRYGGSMYQYDYGAAGITSHLLDAEQVKWAGARAGKEAANAALGLPNQFINPKRLFRQGSRRLRLEFDVPEAPLVLDDTLVSNPGDYGFDVIVAATGLKLSIDSVEVVAKQFVDILTVSDLPTDLKVRVRYGNKGYVSGQVAGRLTGSRGCLRDSDPEVVEIQGTNRNLYNWCPIFQLNED